MIVIKRGASRLARFHWLLLTLILVLPLTGEAAEIRAGSVTDIQGSARLERNGRSSALAVAISVMIGDKIATASKSSLTVGLIDGSKLTLSESSSIVIDQSVVDPAIAGLADTFFVKLFRGTLQSVVTPKTGSARQFEVHTPNAVVGVRGTDFKTEYIEGKSCPGFPQCLRYTDVGVYKGIVEVSNPTSPKPVTVRVTSGYETTVPCELPPASPGPLGMGDMTAPGYH